PYATSDYDTILKDRNIDLTVLGEGELTFLEVIEQIVENGGKLPGEEILKEIRGIAFIPPHMLLKDEITVDHMETGPETTSDTGTNRETISGKSHPAHEPRSQIGGTLAEIWAGVLEIEASLITPDGNFFELGGHSLNATRMVANIHKELQVKIPLTTVFKNQTLSELTEALEGLTQDKYAAITPVEKKEYYPLSAAQKRLYILQQMDLQRTTYNMPGTIPLPPEVTVDKLEETIRKLIQRHESLRTSFHMIPVTPGKVAPVTQAPNNQSPITNNSYLPVQKIHDNPEFKIEVFETGQSDVQRTFCRPFDLTRAPLLRVAVKKAAAAGTGTPSQGAVMLVDMHHIITDGTSLEILTREFLALLAGENLSPLKRCYRDYAGWLSRNLQKQLMKRQEEFWLKTFAGELPILALPTDYPRPVIQSVEGNTQYFTLKKEEDENLRKIATDNNITLYMAILSIFTLLLSKLSGQEDIIVGTPTAGRSHADLENIIGMFVNTLPMRNYSPGNKTINTILAEVKEHTLAAFENQEYQFEELVDRLSVRRDTGRNPIFDVMFNLLNQTEYQKQTRSPLSTPSILSTTSTLSTPGAVGTSKLDLTLSAIETGDHLYFHFEYCTKLFKEKTIKRFITYFKGILRAISNRPRQKIANIEIITEEEKQQILYNFNDTAVDCTGDKTIHELFEEQVERAPDNTATVGRGKPVGKEKIKDKEKIKGKKEIKDNKKTQEQLPQIGTFPDV
ncbi:MAG: hypothetical protein GY757_46805, partial [bacterium]|nr:hypothetical protein [bacterium]